MDRSFFVPRPKSTESAESHESRKSLKSRESRESRESRLRVAIRVGRVDSRQSRRVGQVPLADIVGIVVGVVVDVGSDHIFGLILIAKVVLSEENARNGVDLAVIHVIFP